MLRTIAMCVFALGSIAGASRAAQVVVDGSRLGQTWEGWGTTDMFSLSGLQVEPEANSPGDITSDARKAILKLYYHDLGMTRVRFWPMGYEPADAKGQPPVPGPKRFVWEGRGTRPVTSVNPFCEDHLTMGREFRSPEELFVFYPSAHQWESWMAVKPDSPTWHWGADARFSPAMVDRYAEHAVAAVLHIKEAYHYELPSWSLFNEPTNTAKPSKETTLALVLACGRKFKENNLKTTFSICDDVTPEASAQTIEYVLANEEARRYVGAVSYHRYCGDFVLETVKPLLERVSKGEPLVKSPVSFYASAIKYGKSVWVSEQCSYGADGITHFDAGRARANHVCDEINNGKVNAFDFMLCYFVERGKPGNEETPIFLRFKDHRFVKAEINPIGWWLSHFTRYIRPGAVQLGVWVDDPVVKAVAFRHEVNKTVTVVVINNHAQPSAVSVRIDALPKLGGMAHRVGTSPQDLNEQLPDLAVAQGSLIDTLPATSVVTYTIDQGR